MLTLGEKVTHVVQIRTGGQGEYSLKGRVVVIAGGSGGIGAATARRVAAAGARVVIGFNTSRDRADKLAQELAGEGHHPIYLPMQDSVAIDAAADNVNKQFGRVDVLINSAGITKSVPHANLKDLDDSTFDQILLTNVRGPFSAIRAFAPLLRASGDGAVVNISSISAATGLGSSIAYCASKAALDTMSVSLARVLAPEVRVITVSPAAVATDFVPGRGREGVEKQAATTPLKIAAEPDDVAMAIVSSITHLRLTTGSTIVVDSGRHL